MGLGEGAEGAADTSGLGGWGGAAAGLLRRTVKPLSRNGTSRPSLQLVLGAFKSGGTKSLLPR